jgi:hypothetical protein
MRFLVIATAVCILGVGTIVVGAAEKDGHRELGAHEHGRGSFNLAVEGKRVSIELEVPGVDIVGFEHAPSTPAQITAVDKAKVQLGAPLALFKLPAAAGCRVSEASVEVETGGHDHDHDKAHGKSDKADAKKEVKHTEFHAQYVLECSAPGAITSIDFAYFGAFAGAQKLDVAIVTAKGQSKFEVTRDKPRLDLSGMM